jgi:sterol desaturase/sphingolipid hydroxylase (fatty acid hydroxylase superfamily)
MDLTLVAIPLFLTLLAVEAVVAVRRGLRIHEAGDTAASLAMGVGSIVADFAWKGLFVAATFFLHERRLFELGGGVWVFVVALLADDFIYYWYHRTHHEVRVLWASHVPHHSSQRYNLSTALRQSWTPFTALPFALPLPLLGFDPALIVTVHSLNLLYQFWIHTETIGRLGPLEWVLNTPSHHRVHHASNARYIDRNYGGILIVWDRLFGTFEPEADEEPVVYGLTKNIGTRNPLRIAFHEWAAVLRDAARAPSLRVAFGHLLQPPGWRPVLARPRKVTDSSLVRAPGLPIEA